MTSRDITQYWTFGPAQAWIASKSTRRPHSAGAVLKGANEGDRLWVFTSQKGRLFLVRQFVITHAGLSQKEAAKVLGAHPKTLWEAPFHVVGSTNFRNPHSLIDIHKIAPQLRFVSDVNSKLKMINGLLDPQTLRSLRTLTAESALVLKTIWKKRVGRLGSVSIEEDFDPTDVKDARRRIQASIVQRQGQGKFRTELLRAYDYRCAITKADAVETLEAAHISPYFGAKTSVVANGILLRADLHTLFDVGLIAVDTETMTLRVAPSLRKSTYSSLEGQAIRLPFNPSDHPSKKALNEHRQIWKL